VDSETACSVFEESDENWQEKALEVARRKARSIGYDHPDFKLKLWRFMSYRGFSSDQISAAVDTLLRESSE
ncbi:MAG TPA: hypothetical protein DE015_01385, partial [Oceanospirillales bacterium]|nr:hypothetical protein [Oceanospirillales bacterium]